MRVAHFGTFDVENYGDLLFPLVLEHALQSRGIEVTNVSPVGGPPVWEHGVRSVGIEEFFSGLWRKMDAFIIGGGNIIHSLPSSVVSYNVAPRMPLLAYPGLWITPGLAARERGAPLIWNCPGVPQPLEESVLSVVGSLLRESAYVAVRDETSRNYLARAAEEVEIKVVPDTALALPQLWSRDELYGCYRNIFEQRAIPVPERTCVFHVKERYRTEALDELASVISSYCQTTGVFPVLLAIGPVHGDHKLAREVASLLTVPAQSIDEPRNLKDVTALLACADGYIGSSLHGFLIASAYQKPALLVASEKVPKFRGCMSALRLEQRMIQRWADILTAPLVDPSIDYRQRITEVHAVLDQHWEALTGSLKPAGVVDPKASDLLAETYNLVERDGLRYLHARLATLEERNSNLNEGTWSLKRRAQRDKEKAAAEAQRLNEARRDAERSLRMMTKRSDKQSERLAEMKDEIKGLRRLLEAERVAMSQAASEVKSLIDDERKEHRRVIAQLEEVLRSVEQSRLWKAGHAVRRFIARLRPVHDGTFEGVHALLSSYRTAARVAEERQLKLWRLLLEALGEESKVDEPKPEKSGNERSG